MLRPGMPLSRAPGSPRDRPSGRWPLPRPLRNADSEARRRPAGGLLSTSPTGTGSAPIRRPREPERRSLPMKNRRTFLMGLTCAAVALGILVLPALADELFGRITAVDVTHHTITVERKKAPERSVLKVD